jgi:Lanthionine synthetase C-like protein
VLYSPEAYEPLTEALWDERRVRAAVREIVADADAAFDPDELWPAHEWDAWKAPPPLTCLYCGASGVLFALDVLRRRGLAESRLDLAPAAARTLEAFRAEPDFPRDLELPVHAMASLLSGETGILAVAFRVAPSPLLADELFARVRENVDEEVNELMWGTPGTMVAARAMLDWTGERRWADVWRESAEALLARREANGLWTQNLHGRLGRRLGPAHGAVGAVRALLDGGDLLGAERRAALRADTGAALARTAVVEDGLANWPTVEGGELPQRDGEIRLQWCHGAPGIVVAAADCLDEDLMLAAAELVWRAGPHVPEKGFGICHGTAGNGYAFLRVFERTGDELWLERARRFAVHALEQVARGRGRYSLWTGGVGVALYASDCLDARAGYPVVDTWE